MSYRNRQLLDLARDRHCTVGSPICNRNPETTVTAHNPFGDRGTGTKCSDADSCWSCSACHDFLDGRVRVDGFGPDDRRFYFQRGKTLTQEAMWELGLIQVTGAAQKRDNGYQRSSKILPRDLEHFEGRN